MMLPGYMPDYMGWFMVGSYIFWSVLAVVGVVALVRLAWRSERRPDAKAILDDRLARGDIDGEEYRSRSTLLGG